MDYGTDERVFDLFDALPNSANYVATSQGAVIGGCRATIGSAAGLPCDYLYNFGPHFRYPAEQTACGSHLWVDPTHRTAFVGMKLVRAAMAWGRMKGVVEVAAAVRPEAEPLFRRLGYMTVAPPFQHPTASVPVVPMMHTALNAVKPSKYDRL